MLIVAALAYSCGAPAYACGTGPQPRPDGGATCEQAEARLQELPCTEGFGSPGRDGIEGTADDKGYAELCRELEVDFPGLADPGCIVEAVDCASARECAGE